MLPVTLSRYRDVMFTSLAGFLKCSSQLGGHEIVSALLLPKEDSIPKYKTWSYLIRNEIAVEVGRKMFYTDSHGA